MHCPSMPTQDTFGVVATAATPIHVRRQSDTRLLSIDISRAFVTGYRTAVGGCIASSRFERLGHCRNTQTNLRGDLP